jgi:exosome complex exonuclease RRP6
MDSFKTLQDEISKALVATTRSASHIGAADIAFQRSLNPEVGAQLDAQNARLLHLAQRLLGTAAASSDAVGPKLPDVEALDANWRGVVDVIDSLLEKADISLDEYTGVVKRLSPGAEQVWWFVLEREYCLLTELQTGAKPRPNIAEKKHIPKPQLLFEHVPTNNETGGFRPLITSKPHAMVPLETCLKTFKDRKDREQYAHRTPDISSNLHVIDILIRTNPRSNPTITLHPYTKLQTRNRIRRSNPPPLLSSTHRKHLTRCWLNSKARKRLQLIWNTTTTGHILD